MFAAADEARAVLSSKYRWDFVRPMTHDRYKRVYNDLFKGAVTFEGNKGNDGPENMSVCELLRDPALPDLDCQETEALLYDSPVAHDTGASLYSP